MSNLKDDIRNQVTAFIETITHNSRYLMQMMREIWPLLVIILLALFLVIFFARPAPPKHVLMGTGPKGSSHEKLGQQYAKFFAKYGITLELIPTTGAVENFHRLQDRNDPMMAAFSISGAVNTDDLQGVETLGSIDYHPAWFFYKSAVELPAMNRFTEMAKRKISIGNEGSGTNLVAHRIIEMNEISPSELNLTEIPSHLAIEDLQQGKIDGLFIVDSFESPNVKKLLAMPGLQVGNFARAEAYADLDRSFEALKVPRGGLSLKRDWPSSDLQMIAVTTEILVDDRLHPAIQMLFLQAAKAINGPESFFSQEREFPSFKSTTLPRSHEAEIFYQKGPPSLLNYLPFWLAEFFDRMFLLLLPFAALAYPLIRSMPNYYRNRIRAQINQIYGSIKFFEQQLSSSYDVSKKEEYLRRVDDFEREALSMTVPALLASDYYTLRSTIAFVGDSLRRDAYQAGVQQSADNLDANL